SANHLRITHQLLKASLELSVRRFANQDLDAGGATLFGISSAVDLGLLDALAHEYVETKRRQPFALEPLPQCVAGGSCFGRSVLKAEDFKSGPLEIVPRLGGWRQEAPTRGASPPGRAAKAGRRA